MKRILIVLGIFFSCSVGLLYAQLSGQQQVDALNTRISMDTNQIASLQAEIAVAKNVENTDSALINQLNIEIQMSQQSIAMIEAPSPTDNSVTAPATITTGQNWTDNSLLIDNSVNATANSTN
jgi:hypothetical protein